MKVGCQTLERSAPAANSIVFVYRNLFRRGRATAFVAAVVRRHPAHLDILLEVQLGRVVVDVVFLVIVIVAIGDSSESVTCERLKKEGRRTY
jgi:hypothetical protein